MGQTPSAMIEFHDQVCVPSVVTAISNVAPALAFVIVGAVTFTSGEIWNLMGLVFDVAARLNCGVPEEEIVRAFEPENTGLTTVHEPPGVQVCPLIVVDAAL